MNSNLPKSKFTMAGTERTGQYVGVVTSARGTVAVREYAPSHFRIRVEPKGASAVIIGRKLTRSTGWKQPGDDSQNRFSKTTNTAGLGAVLAEVTDALGVGSLKKIELDNMAALRHVAKAAGVKVSIKDAKATVLVKVMGTASE